MRSPVRRVRHLSDGQIWSEKICGARPMNKKNFDHSETIRNLAMKILGIAHLTELQGLAECPAANPEEVFYGVSLILQEIAQSLKDISNKIENTK